MSWTKSKIGDVLSVVKNGINCAQNKIPIGEKITRIETIAKKSFDFQRVGYANLTENEKERSQLKVGDILFSHINSPIHVGKTAIYEGEEDIYHGINLLLMRTNEDVNPKFFNHFLNHLFATRYWEQNCKKSVNQASVNQKDISKVEFNYPPLPIQQKIVTKLNAIIAEIDKATAAAEANVKNTEALFQSYLTQAFEYEGSEWQRIKVSELGRVQSGGTPLISKKEYWGDEIEWFSSGELNDLHTLSSIRRVTFDGIKNSNAKIFPINSLLIGMYDTAAMKMSLLSNPAAFNQAIVGIEPTEKINMIFLYYALTYIKPYVLSLRRGVRQKNLSLAKIKDLTIQLPKIEIQNKVAERLNFFKETSNKLTLGNLEKINQYIKLKNSILNKAFNGELVKE